MSSAQLYTAIQDIQDRLKVVEEKVEMVFGESEPVEELGLLEKLKNGKGKRKSKTKRR
jgi:hypothetical protein